MGSVLVAEKTQHERDVEQLLKDYRSWHTGFGAARALEDTGVVDAAYGPAGYIWAGAEFAEGDRRLLAESFDYLEHALTLLKIERNHLWLLLLGPYIGDPGDPSIVDQWRRQGRDNLVEYHDQAIRELAHYLRHKELHPVYPKLMSESEEARIEHQNAEVYAVFQRLRVAGASVEEAKRQTADVLPNVTIGAVERIVEHRSEAKPDRCAWGACERAPFSQNLCMKHYQQARRERQKRGEGSR